LPPFRYAIFDLDGVLVDTAEFHYLAWKAIADEIGATFDRKKNERLRGVPRMQSLEIVIEGMPRRPSNLEDLATRKNALYVEMIRRVTPGDLLPGVQNLLEQLRSHGIARAVASSSKNAHAVIGRLGIAPLLNAVVDGFGFQHAKPAPDVFLNAAGLLGAEPQACVVVEDAQSGIEAAKAARMFAVGIARDESLIGADLLVRSPAEIPLSLWGIESPR
jgi:beta-phosphoglucomutase